MESKFEGDLLRNDRWSLVLEYLEFIGIKGYEGKAYLTLLELGEETAPKIASKAGIPLPRIYDVLESLSRKGLVEVKAGRPRKYRALPPAQALTRYIKSHIDELMKLNAIVIEELQKLYRTKESQEPYIWLSYSLEASIERTRSLLKNMEIDGFASLRLDIFRQILNMLSKKLGENPGAPFALTLLEYPDHSIMEKLEELGSVEVRVLPTGIINAIEIDRDKAVLFGGAYTLFTSEPELIVLLNDAYYYGYWRYAKKIKEFMVTRETRYRTRHHWLALSILEIGLKHGYNALVNISGYKVKTKEPVELKAYVKEVRRSTDDSIRSIIVETLDGNELSVGGFGASVEDIEARYIEIEFN